ncbi:MAG: hypothetical protein UT24_C0015G0032 [Candidatus Woesebacteria bacterium GW2011_GWB1_39_12]|uniref:HNH nuclease domain-containing protein n=1 Tax=Candidatus Woesebacteria bacterium GW2011_GWB1_39_12 TaxID=1618574 RepID=A0A0G0M7X2_9BACT|nr:MAG: hypothetical protein UT24_C0015G0032 [Candidatus Woesebacteria bacterium GW2011_GWB1_39_12]
MNTRRKNKVWSIGKEEFAKLVAEAYCIADIIFEIGFDNYSTSHYKRVRERITEEHLTSDHLIRGGLAKNRIILPGICKKIPIEEILVENSSYNRTNLKKRLIKNGMLKEKCAKCGMNNEWQSEKLVLQIDHINGIWNDNRIDNLRLLCPNCHSQTKTFTSKNRGRGTKKITDRKYIFTGQQNSIIKPNNIRKKYCHNCGKEIVAAKTGMCAECYHVFARKVIRPSSEELLNLMKRHSLCAIGRIYGVSDNAVRKWAKSYGLIK